MITQDSELVREARDGSSAAFAELVRRDGTIVDILPQLGVLLAIGVVLLAVASWRLQRVITRP